MIDVSTNQISQIGKHELGVKGLVYLDNMSILISGGWDGKIHFWDTRSPNPVLSYDTNKKILSMSCTFPLLVVGMSDRYISYFNLNKINNQGGFAPDLIFESPFKMPTTVVTCFNEPTGYALGSIEGRVAIKYVDLNNIPVMPTDNKIYTKQEDFAFRCHRTGDNNTEVYPINSIAFNNVFGTFCTGGGDGTWIIWDKESKSKLRTGALSNKSPITALEYSPDGNLLVYAYGYDWHKGVQFENSYKAGIKIHYLPDTDKKKKVKVGNNK